MERFDDELYERFSRLTQVPMSDDLQRKILAAVREQQHLRRRPRRFDIRSFAAGIGGVGAAAVLVWGAWNYGSSVTPTLAKAPLWHPNPKALSSSVLGDNILGLQLAPISVQYLANNGKNVEATLLNIGTQTLNPDDYVGVLSFQQSADPNLLGATDWIVFVDPPHQALAPGDSASWSFHTVTAPGDQTVGHLTETPKLVFFKQETVIPTKADVKWSMAPLRIISNPMVSGVTQTNGGSGLKFHVTETIRNTSAKPLNLDHCLAIVWFSNGPDDDWTAPGAERFMATLDVPTGKTLAPNESYTIVHHLVGGLKPDVRNAYVHVEFIQR